MRLTLFDLDGTLLPTDSDHAFGEFMVRMGWADPQAHAARNEKFFRDYQAGCLDMHDYIDFATSPWRDRSAEEIQQVSDRFMLEVITPHLHESAHALVRQHRQQGDRLAIVTATNDFITGPIARAFGVETLIATELERDGQGRVTGRIRGTPCLREGKIERVNQWLAQEGTRWEAYDEVVFYSDSTNDLPLLERVTHPVATNPAPALAKIAAERGWTVLNLFE